MTADQIDAIAQACHEANRAWCLAHGDASQIAWSEAPDWQRDSVRDGVLDVLSGNGPEQCYASWLAEQKATGWIYGPGKDVERKQHPCMVPYVDLPPALVVVEQLTAYDRKHPMVAP